MAVPAIIRVADEKKLFDLPDARKLHNRPIASLGGVGIFIGLFIATLLSISNKDNPDFQYFFASAIVIFFLGLKDDILILSPTKKFLGQLAATAILVHLGNIRIDSMHGMFGIHQLPDLLSIPLSYITIIVIINAYNLIDGVDGLAGSLGILTTAVFGYYFSASGMTPYAVLSFSMMGSLCAFLYFNFNPARIFMGDSGSLLLGLVNAILVIKFMAIADTPAPVGLTSAVAIGFSILIVPLLDTLRVFSIRIAKGRSPFSPDRNHVHHLLLDRGLNHKQVTFTCLSLNSAFIAMAYFGRQMGPTVLLSIMIPTFFALIGALIRFVRPVRKLVIAKSFKHSMEVEPLKATAGAPKMVTMANEVAVAEQ
ncbi:MAG TPA: MraY family glycosyltransferase [Flavisolibacter sp.]|jgi:UDP-N-acetylmuramyl pentapeptide phosphotransferase/UDP-N-acetylglucosamine-1-phosphate transferase|nr:MraY family glycosyltransferase [Flavisolibacter sp.]